MTASFTNRSLSLYDWQTRFHGESRDDETGYYNYGYRYYLPELGKWPSRDPLWEIGGVNLYAMVRNDPNNRVDFWGLCEFGTSCNKSVDVGASKLTVVNVGMTWVGRAADSGAIKQLEDILGSIFAMADLQGALTSIGGIGKNLVNENFAQIIADAIGETYSNKTGWPTNPAAAYNKFMQELALLSIDGLKAINNAAMKTRGVRMDIRFKHELCVCDEFLGMSLGDGVKWKDQSEFTIRVYFPEGGGATTDDRGPEADAGQGGQLSKITGKDVQAGMQAAMIDAAEKVCEAVKK
jgi:RHS repeat-associated protein